MSGVCKCLLLIVCEDIFMVSSQIEEVAYSIYHDNARGCFRRHHILCLYLIVVGVRIGFEAYSHGKMGLALQHKCLENHFVAFLMGRGHRQWRYRSLPFLNTF